MVQQAMFSETERAIHNSRANADPEWVMMAESMIERLIQRGQEFSTDDVLAMLRAYPGVETQDKRALGAIMLKYAKLKKIRATDKYKKSTDPNCHSRPKMIWQPTVSVKKWRSSYVY